MQVILQLGTTELLIVTRVHRWLQRHTNSMCLHSSCEENEENKCGEIELVSH
jgi:hypothetical protein